MINYVNVKFKCLKYQRLLNQNCHHILRPQVLRSLLFHLIVGQFGPNDRQISSPHLTQLLLRSFGSWLAHFPPNQVSLSLTSQRNERQFRFYKQKQSSSECHRKSPLQSACTKKDLQVYSELYQLQFSLSSLSVHLVIILPWAALPLSSASLSFAFEVFTKLRVSY